MNYITRQQWGAVPPKWRETFPTSEGVFIHYNGPAVAAPVYAGTPGPVRTFLQGIQRFHMGPQRGWPDIAYSWACSGTEIFQLRGWGVAQAATLDWNWKSHSIFLILGEGQPATEGHWANVRTIVAEHNRRYGAGFVKGHRQAPNSTSCPGDLVIADLAAGKGNPRPTPTPPPQPTPTPPNPTPMEDDDMRFIVYEPRSYTDNRPKGPIWLCSGVQRRHLRHPEEVSAQLFLGARELKAASPGAARGVLRFLESFEPVNE
jgi:hypothetical protein